MLKSAYLLAKIGADTAENKRHFPKKFQLLYPHQLAAATLSVSPTEPCAEGDTDPARSRVASTITASTLTRSSTPGASKVPCSSRSCKIASKACELLQFSGFFRGLVLGCIETDLLQEIMRFSSLRDLHTFAPLQTLIFLIVFNNNV